MPARNHTLLTRIVDRLAAMAADADYAQRRLFEIRTGIDLSAPPVTRTRTPKMRSGGVRTNGAGHTHTA